MVAWREVMTGAENVSVQRITAAGDIAPGWPLLGVSTSTDNHTHLNHEITADGEGGAIVVWEDYRPSVTDPAWEDVYAQRVTASGALAPSWPVGGVLVSGAYAGQLFPRLCSDGAGGAFITWQDGREGRADEDIYAQHLAAGGMIVAGWPVDGLLIAGGATAQDFPGIIADGAGGALLVWRDGIGALYAQHVTASGALAPGWPAAGVVVCPAPGRQGVPQLVPDGTGGAIVAWDDFRTAPTGTGNPYAYSDIYAQHVTVGGTIASGWSANGVPVCVLPRGQYGVSIAPDGVGGVILAWDDYRTFGDADTYVQRVRGDGTLATGWPLNGLRVSTAPDYQFHSKVVADGLGGAYVAYENYGADSKVYAQHVTGSGTLAPGWIATGTPLANVGGQQSRPTIVSDDRGGAIVAWEDSRNGGAYLIYAQRLVPDGPVAVALSLVSAVAEPERVRLTWHAADGAGLVATVERRGTTSAWQALATIVADGTGALEYEDRAVVPGTRYAYRLRYRDGDVETLSAETWVEVPRAVEFALEGLRPNPAVGDLTVAFSLAADAPATLELLDVSGRRVIDREVGSLGAGRHIVRMTDGPAVAPGMYWLRLTQGGRSRLARGVVVR